MTPYRERSYQERRVIPRPLAWPWITAFALSWAIFSGVAYQHATETHDPGVAPVVSERP